MPLMERQAFELLTKLSPCLVGILLSWQRIFKLLVQHSKDRKNAITQDFRSPLPQPLDMGNFCAAKRFNKHLLKVFMALQLFGTASATHCST